MGLADEAVAGVARDVQLVLEEGQPVTRAQLLELEAQLSPTWQQQAARAWDAEQARLRERCHQLGYGVPEWMVLPPWLDRVLDAELERRQAVGGPR